MVSGITREGQNEVLQVPEYLCTVKWPLPRSFGAIHGFKSKAMRKRGHFIWMLRKPLRFALPLRRSLVQRDFNSLWRSCLHAWAWVEMSKIYHLRQMYVATIGVVTWFPWNSDSFQIYLDFCSSLFIPPIPVNYVSFTDFWFMQSEVYI